MAVSVLTNVTVGVGATWSAPATAPGLGAGVTVAGTISGGTDLTPYISSVVVNTTAALLDWTNFASGGYMQQATGLAQGTITVNLNRDFAASAEYSVLRPGGSVGFAIGQVTPYYIDIRSTSAARGSTNPAFVAAWLNNQFDFINGAVGDLSKISIQMPLTGIWALLTA
jgi:hypothetical protein